MLLDAPVAVPDSTKREPSEEVMTLALTPGLFEAELIALAIPCSVSLLESMVIAVDAAPKLMLSVPVPTGTVRLPVTLSLKPSIFVMWCWSDT